MENLVYFLPFLACPVMMGLMMWMMARRNRDQAAGGHELLTDHVAANTSPDKRLAVLRAQLADMERQQAAFGVVHDLTAGTSQQRR